MGGDELLLFDDSGIKSRNSSRKESKPLGDVLTSRYGGSRGYIGASAVADAAEDFDLMDWDRPSLRNKLGKKGRPVFDVSDSEIEAKLNNAWQKDRYKRQEKRHAREVLRAAGLLDKNADPGDLRIKYPNGMTLDDIKTEMRTFLLGSQER